MRVVKVELRSCKGAKHEDKRVVRRADQGYSWMLRGGRVCKSKSRSEPGIRQQTGPEASQVSDEKFKEHRKHGNKSIGEPRINQLILKAAAFF